MRSRPARHRGHLADTRVERSACWTQAWSRADARSLWLPMTKNRAVSTLFIFIGILTGECAARGRWPGWSTELVDRLECGMTIDDIQRLTRREIMSPGSARPFLGSHYISNALGSVDIWLGSEQGRLRHVTLSKVDSLKTTRLSPRRDLCTGELSFLLRIRWTQDFAGSDVYLDKQKIRRGGHDTPVLEVPAGDHELRVEKEGYEPIIRHLRFGPDDRGDQQLVLDAEDLKRPQASD